MPSIWKLFKTSFRQSYDYLGLVLAGSFSWFLLFGALYYTYTKSISASTGGVGLNLLWVLALLVILFVLMPIMTAGVFAAARSIVRRDIPGPSDLLAGFSKIAIPAMGLWLLDLLMLTVLAADLRFFSLIMGAASGVMRYVSLLMMVITFYAGLLWGIGGIYHWPLLIEQNGGVFRAEKKAILMALDNLGFTLGIALVIMLLSALLWASGVGAPLLFMGMISLLESNALTALLGKYGMLPVEEGESGEPTEGAKEAKEAKEGESKPSEQ